MVNVMLADEHQRRAPRYTATLIVHGSENFEVVERSGGRK
jgi:hypothetical protein